MTQIIDLDKHFKEAVSALLAKDHPGAPHLEVKKLSLDRLIFDGAINYHLDESSSSTAMDTIDEVIETNRTSVQQETTVRRHETITNSYTWTTEHSVSVGISVTAEIKVPLIGGVDTTVSTEYSFKSSKSATETKERGWDFEKKIEIPQHTKVTAVLMIEKTKPRVPYTMVGAFSGYVTGIVETPVINWPVMVPVSRIFDERPLAGFRNEGTKTYFHTDGVFEASEGIRALIDVKEEPLAKGEPPRNYIVDVTPELASMTQEIPEKPAG
ncbi:ETX/MTX2 family pore-forming toxin [Nocardia sp. CDC159]|uniref:ETX/MTX2 family pore-forming toxin n=1 Tax=Nocardia pulmonis TaxID=2951408 RepID=A0A9X2IY88_9NOCA|nr:MULTISPECIES: ETX/MTX2 family pore-forming toxin [Nocardia]MCM6774730.1 ETX/MTX2 family pore-forming toxin [Nocardia pulmonis]MCM6787205.1 ETX/MTX2 family pore-forming toxin [Nocardia sp. CDC159]